MIAFAFVSPYNNSHTCCRNFLVNFSALQSVSILRIKNPESPIEAHPDKMGFFFTEMSRICQAASALHWLKWDS